MNTAGGGMIKSDKDKIIHALETLAKHKRIGACEPCAKTAELTLKLLEDMGWHTKEMPEEKGEYLVTIFADSIMENIVIPCRWDDFPVDTPCRFHRLTDKEGGIEDITDYVIAWTKYPDPYDKTHNPINSTDSFAWTTQHI